MNGALFVQRRSKRHMARLMEQYERLVEPHLPPEARADSQTFKGCARDVIKEMTGEASDVLDALETGMEINELAVQMRDQVGA